MCLHPWINRKYVLATRWAWAESGKTIKTTEPAERLMQNQLVCIIVYVSLEKTSRIFNFLMAQTSKIVFKLQIGLCWASRSTIIHSLHITHCRALQGIAACSWICFFHLRVGLVCAIGAFHHSAFGPSLMNWIWNYSNACVTIIIYKKKSGPDSGWIHQHHDPCKKRNSKSTESHLK